MKDTAPAFVLSAADPCAAPIVDRYADLVASRNGDHGVIARARETARQMRAWAAENPQAEVPLSAPAVPVVQRADDGWPGIPAEEVYGSPTEPLKPADGQMATADAPAPRRGRKA